MRLRPLLLLLGAALLTASCEGNPRESDDGRIPNPQGKAAPEPTPATPIPNAFDLELLPAAVNVLPGTSASSELAVRWESEPVPLGLRVEGMPAGFTASVDGYRVTVQASATATVDGHAIASVIATDGVRSDIVSFAIFSQPFSAALDASFGEDGVVKILTRVVDAFEMDDGTLLLLGRGSANAPTLCRLTSDGARDASFGEEGCVAFHGFSYAHSSNRLLRVPGGFVIAGNQTVWRVHDDGTIDTAFSDDGFAIVDPTPSSDWIRGAAAGVDGSIVVVGETPLDGGLSAGFVVRFRPDGSLDWTLPLPGAAKTAAVLDDGRILILAASLHALFPDGSPDVSFGEDGVQESARGVTMAVHAGEIFVGGGALDVIRLDMSGAVISIHDDFLIRPDGTTESMDANSIRIASDGSIVFGGTMGGDRLAVGRRTSDGFIDAGFAAGGTAIFRTSDHSAGALPLRDGGIVLYGECPESVDTKPNSPGLVLLVDG